MSRMLVLYTVCGIVAFLNHLVGMEQKPLTFVRDGKFIIDCSDKTMLFNYQLNRAAFHALLVLQTLQYDNKTGREIVEYSLKFIPNAFNLFNDQQKTKEELIKCFRVSLNKIMQDEKVPNTQEKLQQKSKDCRTALASLVYEAKQAKIEIFAFIKQKDRNEWLYRIDQILGREAFFKSYVWDELLRWLYARFNTPVDVWDRDLAN